jgi:D-serine deaminase-like pyridoxal phosphate-dependent protein
MRTAQIGLAQLRRRVDLMVAVDDPVQVAELSAAARPEGLTKKKAG